MSIWLLCIARTMSLVYAETRNDGSRACWPSPLTVAECKHSGCGSDLLREAGPAPAGRGGTPTAPPPPERAAPLVFSGSRHTLQSSPAAEEKVLSHAVQVKPPGTQQGGNRNRAAAHLPHRHGLLPPVMQGSIYTTAARQTLSLLMRGGGGDGEDLYVGKTTWHLISAARTVVGKKYFLQCILHSG